MNRAVFLDRDGVINSSIQIDGLPYPPRKIEQVEILGGVSEAIDLLRSLGFYIFVVSNQPDVSRGIVDLETHIAIHTEIFSKIQVDEVRYCLHDSQDMCDCRKPAPGMILSLAEAYEIDLSNSFLVGDRWRDIQAGISAGVQCFFIDWSYQEKEPSGLFSRVQSLLQAALSIESKIRGPS